MIKNKDYYDSHYVIYNKSLGLFFCGFAKPKPKLFSQRFVDAELYCNYSYVLGFLAHNKQLLFGFSIFPASRFIKGGVYAQEND